MKQLFYVRNLKEVVMKGVYILTDNQAETLIDVFEKWECDLELLRGELERVTIKEDNKIEEIADRMESLKRIMGYILNEE